MSKKFSKLLLVVANLYNLRFFANRLCARFSSDLRTNPILLKIDIHVRYNDACLNNHFFSKLLLVVANLCKLRLFANIFVCTVWTDLLLRDVYERPMFVIRLNGL